MTEQEKLDAKKEEETKNSQAGASTDEKKDNHQEEDTSQKNEGGEGQKGQDEENVTISKKQLEALEKKAKDFEGIIEKQRLAKLAKREEKKKEDPKDDDKKETPVDSETIAKIVEEKVSERLSQINKTKYEDNLSEAYKNFIKENEWADDDASIEAISKVFRAGDSIEVKDLAVRLNEAARAAFPTKMEEAMREKVRAEILAKEQNLNAGEAGSGGGSVKNNNKEEKKTGSHEDQQIADRFFGGDLERYLKYKKE